MAVILSYPLTAYYIITQLAPQHCEYYVRGEPGTGSLGWIKGFVMSPWAKVGKCP